MWLPKTKRAKKITSHRTPSSFFSVSEVKMHNQRSDTTKVCHAGLLMEERWDKNNTWEISATALEGNPTAGEGWKHHETSSSHPQNNHHRIGQKNLEERHNSSKTSNTQNPKHDTEVRQLGSLPKSALVNTHPQIISEAASASFQEQLQICSPESSPTKQNYFHQSWFRQKKWMANISAGRGHQTIWM